MRKKIIDIKKISVYCIFTMARSSEVLKVAAAISFSVGALGMGATGIHAYDAVQDKLREIGNLGQVTPDQKAANTARLDKDINDAGSTLLPGAGGIIVGFALWSASEGLKPRRDPDSFKPRRSSGYPR